MKINIQSINFDAAEKLEQHIQKKLAKLSKMADDVLTAEVYLKVVKPESAQNKEVQIKLIAPSIEFFACKTCDTFEEANDLCIEAIEKQIKKHKEK